MTSSGADHYGTITAIGGLRMPNVRFRWRPLVYTNFFGNPTVVQAVRSFASVSDALKLLRYTLKHQRLRMRELSVDSKIAQQVGYLYFRGQARVEWSLVPTIYRDLPENKGERDTVIADRIAKTVDFFQRVAGDPVAQHQVPAFEKKSIEQRRAIARHYGMPNEYIDLTTDPQVAVFFATMNADSGQNGAATGNVYMLNLELLLSVFRWERRVDADGLLLLLSSPGPMLEIPYLSINSHHQVVQATLRLKIRRQDRPLFALRWLNPTGIHRIETQKATFLRVGGAPDGLFDEHTTNWLGSPEAWQLLDFLTFKFTFPQGKAYRSFLTGIYNRRLLPPGERLQDIAEEIIGREIV